MHRGTVVALSPSLSDPSDNNLSYWEVTHVDFTHEDGTGEEEHMSNDGGEVVMLRCTNEGGSIDVESPCVLSVVPETGVLNLAQHAPSESPSPTCLWTIYRFPNGQASFKSHCSCGSEGGVYLSTADSTSDSVFQAINKSCTTVVLDEQNDTLPVFSLSMKYPPIVDVSPILQAAAAAKAAEDSGQEAEEVEGEYGARQRMLDACHDVGCFFMVGHGLQPGILLEGLKTSYGALPHKGNGDGETRGGNSYEKADDDMTAAGDRFTKITLHSSTGLVKTNFNPPVHDPIVLPQWALHGLPEREQTVTDYYKRASRVGCILLEEMAQRSFTPQEDLYLLMRGVFYPTIKAGDGEFKSRYLETHTDKSWITLLAATDIDGLQFVDADGETFVDIMAPELPPCCPTSANEAMLINVGDALQMHTQGAFVSRPHRAMNRQGQVPRVSVPLFVEPEPDHWPENYAADKMMMMEL